MTKHGDPEWQILSSPGTYQVLKCIVCLLTSDIVQKSVTVQPERECKFVHDQLPVTCKPIPVKACKSIHIDAHKILFSFRCQRTPVQTNFFSIFEKQGKMIMGKELVNVLGSPDLNKL